MPTVDGGMAASEAEHGGCGKTPKKNSAKASVVFGRQGDAGAAGFSAGQSAENIAANTSSCCAPFEKIFSTLMGFPDGAGGNARIEYGEKRDLSPIKVLRDFAVVPEAERCGIKMAVRSSTKESDGWINQDAYVTRAFDRAENETTARFLFGVFDGHGRYGHDVSKIITERLPGYLAEHPNLLSDTKSAFEQAVRNVDDDVFASLGSDAEFSGSTCVFLMVDMLASEIHVANVGDSRAILGRQKYDGSFEAIPLTEDQKPDIPKEEERIQMQGGFVSPYKFSGVPEGPARVWDSSRLEKPGLACSRSIGDGLAKSIGVISRPEYSRHKIEPTDKFLLIGSDGIWDSVGNQQAVDMAKRYLSLPMHSYCAALTNTVRTAEGGSLVDDTTIIMVVLQ